MFSFLSDVLSSGIWLEAASLSDSSLSDMVPGLINLQLDAKAPSMVLKYKSGWLRWREWALSKIGVPVIHVASRQRYPILTTRTRDSEWIKHTCLKLVDK